VQHTIQITTDAKSKAILLDVAGRPIRGNCMVKRNDQIQWVSPHGLVEVEFQDGTPFARGVKRGDANFQTVRAKPGIFVYKCTVIAPSGKPFAWASALGSGGAVEVGTESRS
jgi:hypothetical protein